MKVSSDQYERDHAGKEGRHGEPGEYVAHLIPFRIFHVQHFQWSPLNRRIDNFSTNLHKYGVETAIVFFLLPFFSLLLFSGLFLFCLTHKC